MFHGNETDRVDLLVCFVMIPQVTLSLDTRVRQTATEIRHKAVGQIICWKYERERERERNVLFNDALSTLYLRLYGVRHMVKDHSDSEKGNPLPPHRLLLSISSKGSFYMHHPTDRITHTTAFVTPVVEHWLEREIAQWVHHVKDRSDDPSHHERTLYR